MSASNPRGSQLPSDQPSSSHQEWTVVAPGPIYGNKKLALTKFPQLPPDWKEPKSKWRICMEKPEGRRQQQHKDSSRTPWVLERRPGEPHQRGVPEGGLTGALAPAAAAGSSSRLGMAAAGRQGTTAAGTAAAGNTATAANSSSYNYFVLLEQGDMMTAFPADMVYQFKPIMARRYAASTLEEAELIMKGQRDADAAVIGGKFIPKSTREAAAKEAEQESAAPSTRDDLDRNMMRLFGSDDEDDEEGGPKSSGRGVGKGTGRGGGRGGKFGRGRGSGGGDGGDEEERDEAPDDIYDGEHDELRPEKPEPAEDWEHELEFDDDDEVMEVEDQKMEDDPGERKKLGLEGEEEEEEEDEEKKTLKKNLEAEEADEGEEEPEPALEPAEGVAPEDADAVREDGEEDEDLDEMAQDELISAASEHKTAGPATAGKAAARSAGAAAAAPGRAATPPAAGRRGATPTPMQAAAPKRASTPPVPAASAAAPAAKPSAKRKAEVSEPGAQKKLREATPPAAPAASAAAASNASRKPPTPPAPKGKAPTPPPAAAAAAAAGGMVTQDEVVEVLRTSAGCRILMSQLKTRFQGRLSGPEATEQLKQVVRKVGRLDKSEGGPSYIVLKAAFGGPS